MYVQLPSHSSCYLQLTSLTYKVYIKFSWCIWEQLNLIICFVIRKLLCSTQTGTIVNSVCKIKSIVVHRTDLHTEYKNVILCRRIRRTLHGVVHILYIGTFLPIFVLWCNQIWVIIPIFSILKYFSKMKRTECYIQSSREMKEWQLLFSGHDEHINISSIVI